MCLPNLAHQVQPPCQPLSFMLTISFAMDCRFRDGLILSSQVSGAGCLRPGYGTGALRYSYRRASIASTFAARRAGARQAMVTTMTTRLTPQQHAPRPGRHDVGKSREAGQLLEVIGPVRRHPLIGFSRPQPRHPNLLRPGIRIGTDHNAINALKSAALAPIRSASVSIATAVNPGCLNDCRTANSKSCMGF